jgi:hypothetical protein
VLVDHTELRRVLQHRAASSSRRGSARHGRRNDSADNVHRRVRHTCWGLSEQDRELLLPVSVGRSEGPWLHGALPGPVTHSDHAGRCRARAGRAPVGGAVARHRRQGHGLRAPEDEVRAFIERTQLPFLASPMSKGVMPDTHPLSVGAARSHAEVSLMPIALLGDEAHSIHESEITRPSRQVVSLT